MSEDIKRTFGLYKLVRDGIVAGHEQEGGSCEWREISGDELSEITQRKVREEIGELFDASERTAGEYADVLEALFKDAEVHGLGRDEIFMQC